MIQDIKNKLVEAMKAKETLKVSTLRMLVSEFNNEKIKLQHELSEDEELSVIRREAKKRKEAIESYKNINSENANSKLEQEQLELDILKEFLPPEISSEEVEKLVIDSINSIKPSGMQDMGKVIADVKSKNSGVDGALVASLVRQKLSIL